MQPTSLTRFAWLSIAAAIATMLLKGAAYQFTGSVGLLSDALESLVNLAGALMALAMLTVAARPADEDHAYGHEQGRVLLQRGRGRADRGRRRRHRGRRRRPAAAPAAAEQVGCGVAVSVAASLVNLAVALVLLRAAAPPLDRAAGRRPSPADRRLDLGRSAGRRGPVALTGWHGLDPVVALAVAANIVWTGGASCAMSAAGLMDAALPPQEQAGAARACWRATSGRGHRVPRAAHTAAGARRFVSVHVLVPADWTVQQGHDLLERIEADIRRALPPVTVLTHLEPLGDPAAMADQDLHRADTP